MRELSKSDLFQFQFWGSKQAVFGILPYCGDEGVTINQLRFRIWKGLWILRGYWPVVFDKTIDAIIIIANPNMPASWWIAIIAPFFRKKVLFWTHGWLRPEPLLKRALRQAYYHLADHIMVYSNRSRQLGIALNYPADRITTIYNSLDYEQSVVLTSALDAGLLSNGNPRAFFEKPELPLIICTARLTDTCRFDLLIHAAADLCKGGSPVNLLLVGEGPARTSLRALANKLAVNIYFYGACYEEHVVGELIHSADLTVSPGKIGLTVVHSLSYGTPAITHGSLDEQMPEVEAIIPGVTGAFFRRDDARDLADVMRDWLCAGRDRQQTRAACYSVIAENWNPIRQRHCIEEALRATVGI